MAKFNFRSKSKAIGRYAEYKLMKILYEKGYFVARAPASGSKSSKYPTVDVIAMKRGTILLFEVKRRKEKEAITIDKEQIEKLKEAQQLSGGSAYIAVYLDSTKSWYIFTLDQIKLKQNSYLLSVYEFDKAKSLDLLTD